MRATLPERTRDPVPCLDDWRRGGGCFSSSCNCRCFAARLWIAPGSAEVEGLAHQYLSIRIWGAPATIALYAVTGWLIATGAHAGGAGAASLDERGEHSAGSVVRAGPWLGRVEGVAIATLIAEWTGLALGLWLCRAAFGAGLAAAWARVRDATALAPHGGGEWRYHDPLGPAASQLYQLSVSGRGLWRCDPGRQSGADAVSEIAAFFLDGFAFAAEALVGQAVGAKSVRDVRRSSIIASQWGVGAVAVLVAGLPCWQGPGSLT